MAYSKRKTIPLIERLMAKVQKVTESGCWIWMGSVTTGGYGQIGNGAGTTIPVMVHRASYEHFKGPIAEGLQIDHLCRVRCCVNPDHLEPVTQQVNLQRGLGNSQANIARVKKRLEITRCANGHEFNETNTYKTKCGRQCRICRKLHRENHLIRSVLSK